METGPRLQNKLKNKKSPANDTLYIQKWHDIPKEQESRIYFLVGMHSTFENHKNQKTIGRQSISESLKTKEIRSDDVAVG